MDFKKLIDEERAVSPVIGVILMVAITVILAAVIGTFVLGLGDQVGSTTPSASIGFEASGLSDSTADEVKITHESGTSIETSSIKVNIGSTTVYSDGEPSGTNDFTTTSTITDEWSAGETITVTEDSESTWTSEQTVRVIYDSPESDSTSTLATKTYTFN